MSEAYFCEKCGYIGKTQEHANCEYLAIDIHWQEKIITQLRAQVKHWKANHDDRVEAARILIERPDLPFERVAAYKRHVELQELVKQQAEALRLARESLVGIRNGLLCALDSKPINYYQYVKNEAARSEQAIAAIDALGTADAKPGSLTAYGEKVREACAKACSEDESGRDSGGYFADAIRAIPLPTPDTKGVE